MIGRPFQDYFDLQLRFAKRYAALANVPIPQAIATCTNLRRRFGLALPAGDDAWFAFLDEINGCRWHADRLRLALAMHARAPRDMPSPFGCFNYDAPDTSGTVRIHFMPAECHRQQDSPLSDACWHERRAELRALLTDLRRRHPAATTVRGLSWLYHVNGYQRLFPTRYLASLTSPTGALHLNGSSIWGQVLNWRHEVRPGMADRVLAAVSPATRHAPWRAFPLQPLAATCSVNDFLESIGEVDQRGGTGAIGR